MKNKKLQASLKYHDMGWTIIPTKPDKTPYVKWEKFKTKQRPDKKQLEKWWDRWPNANPAVVTGENSGINVLDVDTAEGWENLNDNYLNESFLTPISKTPGGGYHVMFDYQPGLSNGVRVLPGCDLRTDGGYAILPPSTNGQGKAYAWLPDLHILKVKPAPMPDFLFSVLEEGSAAGYASVHTRALNKEEYINKNKSSREGRNISPKKPQRNKAQHSVTKRNISFDEPGRDEILFHLAHHLVKGGMSQQEIEIYLNFFAANCNPPFPKKETTVKIKSAIQRSESKKTNLTQRVREWISVTNGNFSATFCNNELQSVTSEDKAPQP